MAETLKLYEKVWCPWCVMAHEWLDAHGYKYEALDVEADRAAYDEMYARSKQRRCPTLIVGNLVLPDFGPQELEVFLEQHNIKP